MHRLTSYWTMIPIICLSLLIACLNTVACAAPTIGQVVWVKKVLKASQPSAEPRVLTRRSPIFEHDELVTDGDSTGEVVFTDSSTMSLRENTVIRLDKYIYGAGKEPTNDAFVVSVVTGGFRTITGAISKNNPNGYQASTPVATIGVQGTQYSVYYNPKKGGLVSKIDRGSIVISNDEGKLTLTKCTKEDIKNKKSTCEENLYARVTSSTSAPQSVAQQPTEFNNEPPLTPIGTVGPDGSVTLDDFNLNQC